MFRRLWHQDEGVLTFEWIMLLTLLIIGVTGGLTAVRDAMQHELAGVAAAAVSIDQSFSISAPLQPVVGNSFNGSDATCATAGAVSSVYLDAARFGVWRTNGTTPQLILGSANACGL